jgi:hypothetical protein
MRDARLTAWLRRQRRRLETCQRVGDERTQLRDRALNLPAALPERHTETTPTNGARVTGDLDDIRAHRASVSLLIAPIVVHAQELPARKISSPLRSIQHHAHSSNPGKPAAHGRRYCNNDKGYLRPQRNHDAGICNGRRAAWLGQQRRDESGNAAQLLHEDQRDLPCLHRRGLAHRITASTPVVPFSPSVDMIRNRRAPPSAACRRGGRGPAARERRRERRGSQEESTSTPNEDDGAGDERKGQSRSRWDEREHGIPAASGYG